MARDRGPRGALGASHLVDGYANGWLVHPKQASFDVVLEWTPQRQVWAALWISALAALVVPRDRRLGVRAPAVTGAATDEPSDADVRVEWPVPPRGTLRPAFRRVAASESSYRCSPVSSRR